MKLCRYGKPGYEKPGVIDGEGRLRDLSKVIDNIGPNELSPRQLKTLSRMKAESLPLVNSAPRYRRAVRRNRQVRRHRPQLLRSRQGGRPADPLRADRLHEGHDVHQRAERRRGPAEELDQARLGDRARRGDRHDREVRERGRGAQPRRRLLHRQRRLRARLPDGHHAVGQGQELRHRRTDRSLARHHRRDHRSANPGHGARCERAAHAVAATRAPWSSAWRRSSRT